MLPIAYFKAEPTEYIIAYVNGQVRQRGAGLSLAKIKLFC